MASFLQQRNAAGNVVVITSIETNGAIPPTTADETIQHQTWSNLTDQIAALGGTRHRFNVAARNQAGAPNGTGYTLVGWGGAQEGDAEDANGAGARLRGALVPDNESLFRAVSTSAGGALPERLNQLLLQAPSDDWPLDNDPKASQALADIGKQAELTSNPRAAFVKTLHQPEDARQAEDDVDAAEMPSNAPYAAADFERARHELLLELRQVARTRLYFSKLASPAEGGNSEIWAAVSSLADRLRTDIKVADDDEAEVDPFAFLEAFSDLLAPFFKSDDVQKVLYVVSTIWETASDLYDTDYGGASTIDSQPRIRADALASTLTNKARTTVLSIERMGDVVVSDPLKLAEVGTYGNCTSPCDPGYEEYSTDGIDVAVPLLQRSLQRSVYEELVPLSFKVWDTGLTSLDLTDPNNTEGFDCSPDPRSPFDNGTQAPPLSYAGSVDDYDPQRKVSRSRVYVMVRKDTNFSWPDDEILKRMFGPVSQDEDPDAGGLGISPQDLMREAVREGPPKQYVPTGVDARCAWGE